MMKRLYIIGALLVMVIGAKAGCCNFSETTRIPLSDVTMYNWDGFGANAKKTTAFEGCFYELNTSTGMVYGDPSVIAYADLSPYTRLEITYTEGSPRVLLNRDMQDGQWNSVESQSHMIDNTQGGWSAKYFTKNGNVLSVDLQQILKDKGFVHLHAIKGGNWANVTVTNMELVVDNSATTSQAAKPQISRQDNVLTIKTSTEGATIYYTLDGSTPTKSSNVYKNPITLTQNCTVKAIAVAEGYENSEIATYVVDWFVQPESNYKKVDLLELKTYNNLQQYGGAWSQETNLDWTSYDYIWLKYSGHQGDIRFVVVYNEWQSKDEWGDLYDHKPVSLTGTEGIVGIKLDKTSVYVNGDAKENGKYKGDVYAKHVRQIFIQAWGGVSSVTLEGIWVGSEAAYKKALSDYNTIANNVCVSPTFSVNGNLLSISSQTEGATIYYTLDGSTPTTSSNVYKNPITLTQNCTIKAIAVAEGHKNSDIATYSVNWFKVESVNISFANLKVSLSTPTANARIYYTTNGNTPTNNSLRYIEPFAVSKTCTVKAIAYKDNFNASEVTSLYIDLNNVKCDTPTFQMAGDVLTINTLTEGATIYYTLDGTTPTTSSNRYTEPVTLTRNGAVKAIAVKEGYLNSEVGSYEVTYFQVEMPSFEVSGNLVTISCGTEGAVIYYIEGDGNLEITEKNRYYKPVSLTGSTTLKAVGVLDGYRNSEVAIYNFTSVTCGDVVFNYDGRYMRLSSTTEGATIYYTTDGSNPTTNSYRFNGDVIAVDALYTINAVAMKKDMNNSKVTSMVIPYLFDGTTASVKEAGLLSKAFEWNQGTTKSDRLEVRGPLNVEDLAFVKTLSTVEHLDMKNVMLADQNLPDQSFANMNIVSIELPAGITQVGKGLFKGCNNLAAIIWNANHALTSEALEGVDNPNLLVYTYSLTFVPTSTNVVSMVNDKALNIVLRDAENGNFYCPRKFTAQQISYTRDFKLKSGRGASAGWETIALPFNVATITHEHNGLLAPFGSGVAGAKPFWLYSLQSTGFNPAMEIVANTPYIICMPNHEDYADEYNQGGSVTFAATNVDVPVTTTQTAVQETERSTISLIPTFRRMAKSNSLYAINREAYGTLAPGSVFIQDSRDAYPFEAYSTISMKEVGAAVPLYISIFEDNTTTGIIDIPLAKSSNSAVKVYSLNGLLVKSLSSENELKQLPKGVYVVNGRKVVVK